MAQHTSIEWTGSTWNPLTGCSKVSPGCKNCYAERMAKRLQAMGNPNYRKGFEPAIHEHAFDAPLKWKKPRTIFVNSMSDLFLDDFPDEVIKRLFDIMGRARWHTFQILTKRSERLVQLGRELAWTPNIWMGVTVENQECAYRIDHLRKTGATVSFLSMEPLLTPVAGLDPAGIDWVIVGGESGPKARPMEEAWVLSIRDACVGAHVPFFFKQWGGVNKKKAGRSLEGRLWGEMPCSTPALTG
jgi:protein gp37